MNDKKITFSQLLYNETLHFHGESLTRKYYQHIMAYDLILKQNVTTPMQIPRIDKIVLNTTSRNYVNDKKHIISTLGALELISGQKPQLTYAQKSIANFKIRQHQILGCKLILHETSMYLFLDKLIKIIFPRIREYPQKKSLLKNNYLLMDQKKKNQLVAHTFGFNNLMIFPELENHYELVDFFRGMNCTFVFSNSTPKTKNLLLSGYQLPI